MPVDTASWTPKQSGVIFNRWFIFWFFNQYLYRTGRCGLAVGQRMVRRCSSNVASLSLNNFLCDRVMVISRLCLASIFQNCRCFVLEFQKRNHRHCMIFRASGMISHHPVVRKLCVPTPIGYRYNANK